MDGTLGSQTAWMLDGSGVRDHERRGARGDRALGGGRAGWPVAVHAIGDRANREALDAFEATRDLWQPLGLRHRIEHAQCLDPADVGRFAELGVACSVQFSHAPSDRDLAERFWGERLDGTYAFRSLTGSRRGRRERLGRARRGARPARRDRGGRAPDDRRPARLAPGGGGHGRAGAPRVDRHARLARGRRAAPRDAPPRLSRRSRRARPRPGRVPARRARRRWRWSRRWSAAAGCTTRLPGTEPCGNPYTIQARSSLHFVTWPRRHESTRTMLPVHEAGECSVAATSEIVGAKWTVLIVHDLSEGPRRFTAAGALRAPGSARGRSPSACAGSRPRGSSCAGATRSRRRASSTS